MARPLIYRIDWLLLLVTLSIAGLGLPYLHSASPDHFMKQVRWIAIGVFAMTTMLMINYRMLLHYAYEIYGAALAMLVLVLMLPEIRGARSWIKIPGVGFSIQPAEIIKLALIITLARHLMKRENQSRVSGLVIPFLLTLIPMGLILKQPDLGSAILLPALLLFVIFASGGRITHLLTVVVTGAASCIPMWLYVLRPYQKRRILAFLDRDAYEAREAYQLVMSLIAIGSGGALGEGLGNGTLNSLDLLPDKHTDFIFVVIAEEGGFVIAGILLVLYLILILGGLHIAHNTKEPGGRLIAVGVSALLGAHVLVNIGVVTAMLPTTGITLPLVSYGGSSMVITFAMIGLLLNVGASDHGLVLRESFMGNQEG